MPWIGVEAQPTHRRLQQCGSTRHPVCCEVAVATTIQNGHTVIEPQMLENQFFIRRSRAALAALERGPTAEDLVDAPLAELWIPAIKDGTNLPVLWGHVTGHPLLETCSVRTSPLLGLSRKAGWARTFSQWYRLGEPIPIMQGMSDIDLGDLAEDPLSRPFGPTGYKAIVCEAFLETLMTNVIAQLRNLHATGS